MSRPWIKLHTAMLHHPGIGRLSDQAHRAWITMLLMAAESEDLGAIGSVADVAWMIHATEQDVDAALGEMGDRIVRDGDLLRIRDWSEWQEPVSAAERMRDMRARQRNEAVTHALRTESNEGPITCDAQTQIKTQTKTQKNLGAVDAPPEPDQPPAARPKRVPTPPAHLSRPDLWDAVCSWLGLATDPQQLSASTAANLRRLTALYVKAGELPDQVRADADAWWRDDWRGKQGQAPSVAQAQDWRARCRRNGHAPPGRGTEAPEWRKDKPADPRYVQAMRVARIAGDSEALLDMTDLGRREATIQRVLAGAPAQEATHAAAS